MDTRPVRRRDRLWHALRPRVGDDQFLVSFGCGRRHLRQGVGASKHAARAFTEVLWHEVRGTGISVLAVYPGSTATDFVLHGRAVNESQRQAEARFLARGMQPERTGRKILRAIEHERARTLIGYDTRIIDVAARVAPRLFQAAVGVFRRYLPF